MASRLHLDFPKSTASVPWIWQRWGTPDSEASSSWRVGHRCNQLCSAEPWGRELADKLPGLKLGLLGQRRYNIVSYHVSSCGQTNTEGSVSRSLC